MSADPATISPTLGGGSLTNTMGTTGETNTSSMASTAKGRNVSKSVEELKKARETRAAETLKLKDDQMKILMEHNFALTQSLEKLEEEANMIQMEKLAVEQENRSIRDNNFELQSRARAAETQARKMEADVSDQEKNLRRLTDQNSELLRLLESEESLTSDLQSELAEVRSELDEIRQKFGALLTTAKTHEELSAKAAREGQLRAEEIRLLRAETEQLKQVNSELKMKTQVEVEALQEQLRVRKEKQYQLLEKLQAQEEAKKQAEDQVAGMEEQLRGIHARKVELENQLQIEERAKRNMEEANKELQVENSNLFNQNCDLQIKIEKTEKERLKMQAEAMDSGEQLRTMAENVFSLLERLKLAELGKTQALEALKKQEQDLIATQKKNARLIKEATEEARAKMKAELDVNVLKEEVRALKKNNQSLAKKSREEASEKVKLTEQCEKLKDQLVTTESRLSFLLNKVKSDEDARLVQLEDRKKLEAQVISFTEKCDEMQRRLVELGESNRVITQAMRLKQEELNEMTIKFEALAKEIEQRDASAAAAEAAERENLEGAKPGGPDDIENVRLNEGRGRFYLESKSVAGGSIVILKGRKPLYTDWLARNNVNEFLKRAQKASRVRDMIIERLAMSLGLLMVEEEEKERLLGETGTRDKQIDYLQKKLALLQDTLGVEEMAKRHMLMRYIHVVKQNATVLRENASGQFQGGSLQLPESNIHDEEAIALAALLRDNTDIDELNLRGNNITDDGARALANVLAGKSALRLVDLRGNKIGKSAILVLAEALGRSERVRHVYHHAGGKIEAIGTGGWSTGKPGASSGPPGSASATGKLSGGDPKLMVTVETVCVVDCRDNHPEDAKAANYMLLALEDPGTTKQTSLQQSASSSALDKKNSSFTPAVLLTKSQPELQKSNLQTVKEHLYASDGAPYKGQSGMVSGKKGSKKKDPTQMSAAERKKMEKKAKDDAATKLREGGWHGRSEGLDRHPALATLDGDVSSAAFALQGKAPQPLPGIDGNQKDSPERSSSAPSPPQGVISKEADKILMRGRSTAGKDGKKKMSESERKLIEESPYAQPVVKLAPLEGERSSSPSRDGASRKGTRE